jgi:hypothetical protein
MVGRDFKDVRWVKEALKLDIEKLCGEREGEVRIYDLVGEVFRYETDGDMQKFFVRMLIEGKAMDRHLQLTGNSLIKDKEEMVDESIVD